MEKFSLIITAGGTSSRYGSQNKLLEKINDKTVIEHTVSAFLGFENITEIIIPTNPNIRKDFEQLLNDERIKFIEGGDTRQKSVYNALEFITNKYVIIHDGARPFIDLETIKKTIETSGTVITIVQKIFTCWEDNSATRLHHNGTESTPAAIPIMVYIIPRSRIKLLNFLISLYTHTAGPITSIINRPKNNHLKNEFATRG